MRKAEFNDLQDGKGEQVRRLLRHIQESVRRLDDLAHRATQPVELFTPDAIAWRYRLREFCEKLMFLDSKNHGRKGEDLLWRKGFYDVFNTAKKLKKGEMWNRIEEAVLERHLLAGLGFYQHLTHRLQSDCHLDLSTAADCSFLQQDGGLKKVKTILSSKATEASENGWARECMQRCLIYMGDVTRYRRDIGPGVYDTKNLARRYYQQAININPDVGMPHNQLGTLAGDSGHGVDAVYHYMRCLMCYQSFDGAEANLRRALEKNRKMYEERRRMDIYPQFISSYLMVVEVFFFEDDTPYSGQEMCQQTLVDLGHYAEVSSEQPNMALRLLAIMLLCVYRLRQTGSTQVSIAIAFTLALLSHLVFQTAAGLHSVLSHFGLEGSVDSPLPNGHVDSKADSKRKRMNRLLRLRRRKRINSESSEDEELTIDEDSGSDDVSESDDTSSLDSDDEEAITVDTNKNITKENGRIKPTKTMDQLNIISEDALLPAIKISCDYLSVNEEFIRAPSSRPLWSHMVHLFNVLNVDTAAILKDNIHPAVAKALNAGSEEFKQTIPLSEDIELRCLPSLKETHSKLNWKEQYKFCRRDETLLRVLSIRSFGHLLASLKESGVKYDKSTRQFTQTPPPNGVIENKEKPEPQDKEDKEAMMQQMAALWLREEVRDLEESVGAVKIQNNQGGAQLSPYLVPDTTAFIQYMPLLKQLVDSRRFILVVPALVVSELDEGKKTLSGAREAIRWLEAQFRRGSRYVRPQRNRERCIIPTLKYPKRKEKLEWKFFSLLECCYYLAQRSSGQGMVTLLTGEKGHKEHSALANSTGIAFEHVEVFHSKWKTSTKSRG